ncbi:hypothetical protein LG634_10250 [Streptomyces bambusae]|uniref:hypothetical protein n=1 Tax=Streptomyces bambusae TaxID=1550616 RepID=UPI001CFD9E9C|nr:hypothetical protein [Streptomyces bambusae]MCB5165208.1 hypothetical protein [Streptomyces bambusae]
MRGDETQRAVAPGAESRERKGPRHAAPKKSLLTKIQIPAGKAMALAAMPTAVLVGMGMAPKLALADDKDIPFAPGPCVTRSDEPAESQSPEPTKSPEATPSPSVSPSATASPGVTTGPLPTASPSASKSAEDEAPKPKTSPPAAKPDTRTVVDPLDPLGVGDKVKDILDELGRPLKDGDTAPEPTATATPPAAQLPGTVQSTPADDPTEAAIRDAAKRAGAKVEDLSDEARATKDKAKDETGTKAEDDADKSEDDKSEDEEGKDKDGKEPFPCPTYDAEALANAKLEAEAPLLPAEPWRLDSSLLTLYGLDYHGIVEVKTADGKIKKVLKFTASGIDIKDLHQTIVENGRTTHVKARPGSTSTIRDGTVTMYTEELKGNLFGIVPITFSPESPPPLNVPFAFFSSVKLKQAGQFGGTLTVPGLQNWID